MTFVDQLVEDKLIQNFIRKCCDFGLGVEAAFVIAVASSKSGAHLLSHFKSEKAFRYHDDVSLAYLIYERYQKRGIDMFGKDFRSLQLFGEINRLAKEIENLLRKIFKEGSSTIYGPVNHFGNRLCCYGDNFDSAVNPRNMKLHQLTYCIDRHKEEIEITEPKLVIALLANAFHDAFACTNLLYISKRGMMLKFYSHTHFKETKISKTSAINGMDWTGSKYAVAFKIKHNKDGTAQAEFLCVAPNGKLIRPHQWELTEYDIIVGPLLANELIREPRDCFNKLTGEFAMISGYDPENSQLTMFCTKRALDILQGHISKRAQDIVKEEIDWNVLRWEMDDCKAIVTFGPGLSVHAIATDGQKESSDCFTISASAPAREDGHFSESLLANLEEMVNEFCLFKMGYPPLVFTYNGTFYANFHAPKDVEEFTAGIGSDVLPHFELVHDGIVEYLLSDKLQKQIQCKPTEECIICCSPLDDDYWVRLSLCGHVLCDHCFIAHIANDDVQFPLKCAKCNLIMSIQDMRAVFTRNYGDNVASFRHYILPILNNSLASHLRASDKFIRCKGDGCHRLVHVHVDANPSTISCAHCNHIHCRVCGDDFHGGISCYQNQHNKMVLREPQLMHWIGQSDMRRLCPNTNCNELVERTQDGCNHFQCRHCKIHFCWQCENITAASSAKIYAHLQAVHGRYGFHEIDLLRAEEAELHRFQFIFFDNVPPPVNSPNFAQFNIDEATRAYYEYETLFHQITTFPW